MDRNVKRQKYCKKYLKLINVLYLKLGLINGKTTKCKTNLISKMLMKLQSCSKCSKTVHIKI